MIALIERLAELHGERVVIVPPAQGGWRVIVGTDDSHAQCDLATAIDVIALRLEVRDATT